MPKVMKPAECLIVAAEDTHGRMAPKPNEYSRLILDFADQLHGTGVCLKVNAALRACGYDLIGQIRDRGLRVFADLKLFDINQTLTIDGMLLNYARPDMVTAFAYRAENLKTLKAQLPNTEVLGVTVLTEFGEGDSQAAFTCPTEEAVQRFAKMAFDAKIDGIVSSAQEVWTLKDKFGKFLSFTTPAIRPAWASVEGDDQNPKRVMTPEGAIRAGADRIVVGRPITRAKNPRDAVMRTIEEIASAIQ